MSEQKKLTFSQRYGHEAVPRPLQLGELPAMARTDLWNVLYADMHSSRRLIGEYFFIDGVWETILRDVHVQCHHRPLDEWTRRFQSVRADLRKFIEQEPFNKIFDLFQYIMRHDRCPEDFVVKMSMAFRSCQLAYAIDTSPPVTIFQATTPEEGAEIKRNLNDLRIAGLDGCASHLRTASKCINDGDWAGSVRESIHAVESVARQIDPAASNTLGRALASLKRKRVLKHSALIEGLDKLYGYTLGEQGIRHALLEKAEADVTVDEAVFFLGACASFASYLWRKHQAAAAS